MMRTREKLVVLSVAALGLLLAAARPADAVSVTIGNATGAPGDFVPVDVTLQTQGSEVAGTQNDIVFPAGGEVGISADENGDPLCTVNTAIRKNGTTFAFQPPDCEPGSTCTGVRSLVLALNNVDPIPDGSRLYTCELVIAEDADDGEFTLDNLMAGASNPAGGALETTGIDGVVTVEGGVTPADATIHIGSASGEAGGNASIDVTLATGVEVAGTQNDIAFLPEAAIRADENGDPMCTVNPAIRKNGTTFAFQPPDCDVGTTCTSIRALVLALNNVDAIPDGSRLYSCDIAIAEDAAGPYALTCSNAGASTPGGGALETDCTNGTVTVGGVTPGESTLASAITATDTTIPLADASSFPNSGTVMIGDELITYTGKDGNSLTGATRGANGTTAAAHAAGSTVTLQQQGTTPTVTPTRGLGTPTTTPTGGIGTPTRTVTFIPPPPTVICDDSCAIVSPTETQAGWVLLLPAAMLLWLRRRSR